MTVHRTSQWPTRLPWPPVAPSCPGWAGFVLRHPAVALLLGVVSLAAVAAPAVSLELGLGRHPRGQRRPRDRSNRDQNRGGGGLPVRLARRRRTAAPCHGGQDFVRMIGFGLATAVLFDAFVVLMAKVPALRPARQVRWVAAAVPRPPAAAHRPRGRQADALGALSLRHPYRLVHRVALGAGP